MIVQERERRFQARKQTKKRHSNQSIRRFCILVFCGCLLTTAVLWPKILFWVAVGILLHTYVGYPLLSMSLAKVLKRSWLKGDVQPTVTLLVVAHNEEKFLKAKIENSLSLDYPRDYLDIVVASDGSNDQTNEIMRQYEGEGIQAHYFHERSGKMTVINRVFPQIRTEIVVFSDANVIYARDAIKRLVRNFLDESVGAVSGKVTLTDAQGIPSLTEPLYYRYEWCLQSFESQTGSMVGADGAMYAIRRELFQAPSNRVVLDDFVIPMNIARQGKRVVHEPDAKAWESSAASLESDFRRRIRLVAGAVQCFLQGEGLPRYYQSSLLFKYLSHKVLRWCSPVFMVIPFISNLFLLDQYFYVATLGAQLCFYGAALLGMFHRSPSWLFAVPYHFCVVNVAAAIGLVRGILNRQKAAWERVERAS